MDGNLARAPRSYAEPLECSVAAIKSSPSAPLLCSFQGSGYSSTAQQHGKCVPLASSCLTGGFGVGCAVHQQQPPQHNTRMWWMGALQSQPRGLSCPRDITRRSGCGVLWGLFLMLRSKRS